MSWRFIPFCILAMTMGLVARGAEPAEGHKDRHGDLLPVSLGAGIQTV